MEKVRTTVDIMDALYVQAKKLAKSRGVPFRQIVEEGLRLVIANSHPEPRFVLGEGSVKGKGMVRKMSWEEIRDIIYEGRGT